MGGCRLEFVKLDRALLDVEPVGASLCQSSNCREGQVVESGGGAVQGSRASTGEWRVVLAVVAGFTLLRLGFAWWLPTFSSEASPTDNAPALRVIDAAGRDCLGPAEPRRFARRPAPGEPVEGAARLRFEFLGADALYVFRAPLGRRDRREMEAAFDRIEKLSPIFAEVDGSPVEVFELYWCRGFKGLSG